MKTMNLYVAAAALALTGLTALAEYTTLNRTGAAMDNAADRTGQAISNTGDKLQATGSQMADEATTREIKSTLAKITDDALNENRFDDLVNHLSKADRERLADLKGQKPEDLNRVITQFRQDFRAKYNQDFDIKSEHFNDVAIYGGQDKNSATVSIKQDYTADAMKTTTETTITRDADGKLVTPSGRTLRPNDPTSAAPSERQLNVPPGATEVSNRGGELSGASKDIATAGNRTGPASSGNNSNSVVKGNDTMANPGIVRTDDATKSTVTRTETSSLAAGGATLNLTNEGGVMPAWRVNIPDQTTGEALKTNLIKHIQMLDDQKASWPSDPNAAYHAAAFHIAQALNDSSLAAER